MSTGKMQLDQSAQDFLSPLAMSINEGYAADPLFLASQEELRALLFNTARSTAPTRAPTPQPGSDPTDAPNTSSSTHESNYLRQIITSPRRLEYFTGYLHEVAPWLDMFDTKQTFGTVLPRIADKSEALLYAILALSARQLERTRRVSESFESLELYQQSISLMTALLPSRNDEVIATAIILCCLEMMSASARDWRRHLEGCASLFTAFELHGFSGGVGQGMFWCYARMDLCGALISDTTEATLLPLIRWLPSNVHSIEQVRALFRRTNNLDMWANFAVYLCASCTDLLSDRTRFLEMGINNGCDAVEFARRWAECWDDLQHWCEQRRPEMHPIVTISTTPFPHILFTHWAAISANQLYHTACILLLQHQPARVQLASSSTTSALWHAKRICGISETNPHHGCLNNAIQPLWIAGKLFGHTSEHAALVHLIKHIERTTGWGMSWRIRDLEQAWGYPEGTYSKETS